MHKLRLFGNCRLMSALPPSDQIADISSAQCQTEDAALIGATPNELPRLSLPRETVLRFFDPDPRHHVALGHKRKYIPSRGGRFTS